jgi:hypothetical protein
MTRLFDRGDGGGDNLAVTVALLLSRAPFAPVASETATV